MMKVLTSVSAGAIKVIRSLSNGDSNENSKKAAGLDWQNKNFARASCFFVHFFAVTARLREHA